GAKAGGSYAAVLQWAGVLRTAAMQIVIVLAPSITRLHAVDDPEGVLSVSRQAVKLLALMVALPAGLLAGLARPLFETWLGPSFGSLAPLAWVILLPLCVEAAHMPLTAVILAADKVRWMSIATIVSGALNLA